MKWLSIFAIFLMTSQALPESDSLHEQPAPSPTSVQQTPASDSAAEAKPLVEVAFVLDTTGSMGGLIEGAKRKVWFIANQILLGEPRPDVRMALVPYRDKGDTYVTKVFDLTDNIDQVYKDLMAFSADGGGDTPENVNQGLYDAVHMVKWSEDENTLKIIFLVGDCPPHNEYQDVPTYDRIAAQAMEKDICINTILCGGHGEARKVWLDIAARAKGRFLAIAQDGGVTETATPFDEELARLNTELTGTVVAYGDRRERNQAKALNKAMGAMEKEAPGAAAADRAIFAAASGRIGSSDLVQAVCGGEVKLEAVPEEHLPEKMRKMTKAEREKFVAEKKKAREKIASRIKKLSGKRSDYIKAELEKNGGAKDGFDYQVITVLKEQASSKKIHYK